MEVRRYITIVEEILEEGGRRMAPAGKRAAAIAVIKNPFAGKYVEDLTPLIDIGDKLGGILGKMAVDALGIKPEAAENYGKAAIVGEAGEREHAAAILHPKLGTPFRSAVGGGKSLIPSAKKVGGMGTEIDVPLNYKDAAFVRSHFDAMAVRVPDAPRADEIVVALVVTDCGRPHPRIGGLRFDPQRIHGHLSQDAAQPIPDVDQWGQVFDVFAGKGVFDHGDGRRALAGRLHRAAAFFQNFFHNRNVSPDFHKGNLLLAQVSHEVVLSRSAMNRVMAVRPWHATNAPKTMLSPISFSARRMA